MTGGFRGPGRTTRLIIIPPSHSAGNCPNANPSMRNVKGAWTYLKYQQVTSHMQPVGLPSMPQNSYFGRSLNGAARRLDWLFSEEGGLLRLSWDIGGCSSRASVKSSQVSRTPDGIILTSPKLTSGTPDKIRYSSNQDRRGLMAGKNDAVFPTSPIVRRYHLPECNFKHEEQTGKLDVFPRPAGYVRQAACNADEAVMVTAELICWAVVG